MNAARQSIRMIEDELAVFTSSDLQKVMRFNQVELGNFPTPLETRGDDYAIKRDDLSGYGRGGIKTRKLESCLTHIKKNGVTDLVIIVPNISNLRADLELYARDQPLRIHFILSNEPRLPMDERLRILSTRPSNDNVQYTIAKSHTGAVLLCIRKYLSLLLKRKRVAWMLPGVLHPSSVIGPAHGLLEMYAQYHQQRDRAPKHVFISACTGGSAAGLILGAMLLREHNLESPTIHVAKVFPIQLRLTIWLLLWWTKLKYRLDVNIRWDQIHTYFKHRDVDYGRANDELLAICREMKDKHGIDIDPIYGARTVSVMKDFLTSGPDHSEGVVYWHCGFTPNWRVFAT